MVGISDAIGKLPARKRGRPAGQMLPENEARSYRGQPKFTALEIKAALAENFGIPRLAANALVEADKKNGRRRTITTEAVRGYLNTRKWRAELQEASREDVIDLAESVVIDAVCGGDKRMARWVLERLGKKRGYAPGSEPIVILDPAKLTPEQLCKLFDPDRMTDEQIDGLMRMWAERFGFDPEADDGLLIGGKSTVVYEK